MCNSRLMKVIVFFQLLFSLSSHLFAASAEQRITLNPGWNSVFLEVKPSEPIDPEAIFTEANGLGNVESVWSWNPRSSTVEFIQDPSNLIPEQPEWLVYLPPIYDPNSEEFISHPSTNLGTIRGGKGYLIKLGGTENVIWTVSGEPALPNLEWKSNSFNFVGFHLDDTNPKFRDFFASSPAHAEEDIYVLCKQEDVVDLDCTVGSWALVENHDTTVSMTRGDAFWVYSRGSSQFTGPVGVVLESQDGLHYGKILDEQVVEIKNNTLVAQRVYLSLEQLVGSTDFPLYYWEYDPANNIAEWSEVPDSPDSLSLDIDAGESKHITLGVKRSGYAGPDIYDGAHLLIEDREGTLLRVPMSLSSISYSGLWTGYATINKVDQPFTDPGFDATKPTGSEFVFRLIIHVGANETPVRFLQEVIQMWQEGTWMADPDNPAHKIVDTPGRFILLADDSLSPYFSGSSLRDGRPVARRISTAAFGNFYQDNLRGSDLSYDAFQRVKYKVMNDGFEPEGSLTTTLWLPHDDPSNPFVHKYHSVHFPPKPDGTGWTHPDEELFDIRREITLKFSDIDWDEKTIMEASALNWGSTLIGGKYSETITGLLTPGPIYIKGTFQLTKISDVETLTIAPPN